MNVETVLKSQYHAALRTLRLAIEKCPDKIWNESTDDCVPFWRVVYHALFYAHFYLQQDQQQFRPWSRHRDEAQFLSHLPWEGNRLPKACEPYSRNEILEYWNACDDMIDPGVDALDLSAAQCGFPWYQMGTFEHQIVNIRHIQHHAAALSTRLRRSSGIAVEWVAKG